MGLKVTLALASGFSSLSEVMCVLVMGPLTFKAEMQTHRGYLLLFVAMTKYLTIATLKGEGLFWVTVERGVQSITMRKVYIAAAGTRGSCHIVSSVRNEY